jgi:hypothetical protein
MADCDMIARPKNAFADEVASMYAPFKAYVSQVVPLILEHVWASGMQKKSDCREELMNNGWLGRLVTLDRRVLDRLRQEELAEWPRLRDYLVRSMKACARKEQVPGMITDCMRALMPVLEKRFRQNHSFEKKPFHCWWFTIHDDDTHLALHLINAYQPESPFNHLAHFTATMLQAVEHAFSEYPAITVVSCGSWLNQFPRFQKLWPESFKNAQKVLNEEGGFGPGAWGQYMTADGGFNERNADILRNRMKHPFALTEGRCPVEEVRLHLRNLLAKSTLKESL